jgi:hypothetical protein
MEQHLLVELHTVVLVVRRCLDSMVALVVAELLQWAALLPMLMVLVVVQVLQLLFLVLQLHMLVEAVAEAVTITVVLLVLEMQAEAMAVPVLMLAHQILMQLTVLLILEVVAVAHQMGWLVELVVPAS